MSLRSLYLAALSAAPGLCGALFIVGLLSGRLSVLAPGASPSGVALFIAAQAVVLTIVKLGLDQLAFAQANKAEARRVLVRAAIVRRSLPLAALCCAVLLNSFTAPIALLVCLSALADTVALIRISQVNGSGHTVTSVALNLLNYPLFVLLVVSVAAVQPLSELHCAAAFTTSSAVRLLASFGAERRMLAHLPTVAINASTAGMAGLFQFTSYVLNRGDVVLLTVFGKRLLSDDRLAAYLLLAKFLEMAASAAIALGSVWLSRARAQHGHGTTSAQQWYVVGLLFALVGLPAFIVTTAPNADVLQVAGTAIAAASLPLYYVSSITFLGDGTTWTRLWIPSAVAAVSMGLQCLLLVAGPVGLMAMVCGVQICWFALAYSPFTARPVLSRRPRPAEVRGAR